MIEEAVDRGRREKHVGDTVTFERETDGLNWNFELRQTLFRWDQWVTLKQADIIIAAIGRAHFVKGDWVKPGATVIDVGINRVDKPDGGTRLVGDVAFESAAAVAGAITPVPGGVGPMTIACLLRNSVTAACRQAGVPVPEM